MQNRAASMRTSDAERQRAADFLRDACAEGRLSPAELEERLDMLFAGSTVEDIAVLVRDLPGGAKVIPRLNRGGVPHAATPPSLPVRRRRHAVSPAAPVGAGLLVIGVVWLVAGALPPLLAIVLATLVLSVGIVFGVMAIALAPVGLALFAFGWIVQRLFRGPRPRRHPYW
jgi:VIT1/CCC1 family predicted Fe2+/Mn2+ transporter